MVCAASITRIDAPTSGNACRYRNLSAHPRSNQADHSIDPTRTLTMNLDRTAPETTDSDRSSAPGNSISRRDSLALAAAGLTATLLPTFSFAETSKQRSPMRYIKVGQENSQPIEIYYEDHGSGTPVVLIHGWPLNGDAWEKQTAALLAAGHRVITYDRRGFGRSSKPGIGYNYDTFAADLDALLSTLDLTYVSLVGHSMGTGEITRYIGKYGTRRLRRAVLIGTLGPYLIKAPDNPEGVDPKVFDDTRAAIRADRPATLMEFLKNFYSVGGTDGRIVSEHVIEANWAVAIGASPIGTLACVDAWIEDFREDVARNDLPTMIIHGDDDRILPADATSRRQAKILKNVKYVEIKGASHGLTWTRAEEINTELVRFLA
jgi:non-heme chloroperoxidase